MPGPQRSNIRRPRKLLFVNVTTGGAYTPVLLFGAAAVLIAAIPPLNISNSSYIRDQLPAFLRIHREAVVADGHNDAPGRIGSGVDYTGRTKTGHSDLPRFREGGVDAQVFAIWVNPKSRDPFGAALRMLDSLYALERRAGGAMRVVKDGSELDSTVAAASLAAVVGLEGGHVVGNSMNRIRQLHARGLRCFGMTWSYGTEWAASSREEYAGKRRGLTAHGKRVVRLLDTLGMLIDISHLGPGAVQDVLSITKNPVFASHSSCSALRSHERNLTDAQLRAVAKSGGVVMVNFVPAFLRANMPHDAAATGARYQRRLDALRSGGRGYDEQSLSRRDRLIAEARRAGLPTILDVADHIEHAVRVAGIDHVGIGSDFDGIDWTPVGLGDVTELPYLTRELLSRGLEESSLNKILGGNFIRVFREVCSR